MLKPETEAELAEMVAGAKAPLAIAGGGTRPIGKTVAGQALTTAGLSGIALHEPGALTLVAQAGTPVAEIEAALARENQRLAFEPMDHRGLLGTEGTPTIGGVVAGNVSGPRRIQAGACRDSLLGVRFVDGQGRVLKNGGRVMKNVTGYDLVKLMAGSWGTLGVLTEVALKVLPRPEARACVLVNGLSDAKAQEVMSAALGSPYDVTGAAHAPKGMDGHPVTMIRVEGFADQVAYRAGKLRDMVAAHDVTVERDPDKVDAGWRWVRDVALFHDTPGDVWRISVTPGEAPTLAARLDAKGLLYDWGGGLIWALLEEGADCRDRLGEFRGHATLVWGAEATRARLPTFQPEPPPLARLTDGLRAQFDPRGILNPGLMT